MTTEPEKKESPIGLIVFVVGLGILLYFVGGDVDRFVAEMNGYVLVVGLAAIGFHQAYNKFKPGKEAAP